MPAHPMPMPTRYAIARRSVPEMRYAPQRREIQQDKGEGCLRVAFHAAARRHEHFTREMIARARYTLPFSRHVFALFFFY